MFIDTPYTFRYIPSWKKQKEHTVQRIPNDSFTPGLIMPGFKQLSRVWRDASIYTDPRISDEEVVLHHEKFVPVMFETAHAIRRGRNPSQSSILPRMNLRDWIVDAFTMPCGVPSIRGDDTLTLAAYAVQFFSFPRNAEGIRVLQAINVVEKYFNPWIEMRFQALAA